MDFFHSYLALFPQVANLKKKLTHEIKLREALKSGLQRSPGFLPKIPGYVPAEVFLLKPNLFMLLPKTSFASLFFLAFLELWNTSNYNLDFVLLFRSA